MKEYPASQATDARRLIADVLESIAPDVQLDDIDPEGNLQQLADLDSMDFMSLVEGVAARLGVDIPEADYPRLATLSSAVSYVAGRTSQV